MPLLPRVYMVSVCEMVGVCTCAVQRRASCWQKKTGNAETAWNREQEAGQTLESSDLSLVNV